MPEESRPKVREVFIEVTMVELLCSPKLATLIVGLDYFTSAGLEGNKL